jgi:hypothetical protein
LRYASLSACRSEHRFQLGNVQIAASVAPRDSASPASLVANLGRDPVPRGSANQRWQSLWRLPAFELGDAHDPRAEPGEIPHAHAHVVIDRSAAIQSDKRGLLKRVLRRLAHLQLILDQAREREEVTGGQRLGDIHRATRAQDATRLAQRQHQIRRRHVMQ